MSDAEYLQRILESSQIAVALKTLSRWIRAKSVSNPAYWEIRAMSRTFGGKPKSCGGEIRGKFQGNLREFESHGPLLKTMGLSRKTKVDPLTIV